MSTSRRAKSAPTLGSRRARREARGDTSRRLNAVPFVLAAVLVLLVTGGLIWWFVLRDEPAEEPTAWEWIEDPVDGVHARDVPAEDWETGWCLDGYEAEDAPADVVDCQRSYDVQLLLRRDLSDGPYPGDAEVIETAHQWCEEDLEFDAEAVESAEFPLHIQLWHPTESTWQHDGDRGVSCFLTRPDGGQMTGDYLAEEDETAEDSDVQVDGEGREETTEPSESATDSADEASEPGDDGTDQDPEESEAENDDGSENGGDG